MDLGQGQVRGRATVCLGKGRSDRAGQKGREVGPGGRGGGRMISEDSRGPGRGEEGVGTCLVLVQNHQPEILYSLTCKRLFMARFSLGMVLEEKRHYLKLLRDLQNFLDIYHKRYIY